MNVAITGGICSGKSTICRYIQEKNIYVFYSDIEAKIIANSNDDVKKNLINIFGTDCFIDDIYNFDYIRNIVFNDKNKLNQLNQCFIEPVYNEFINNTIDIKLSFLESALIFEHNIQNRFDLIIGVYCDEEKTIERLRNRNGFNDEEIKNILKHQLNPETKMKMCDFVIDTTNGIDFSEIDLIITNIKTHM